MSKEGSQEEAQALCRQSGLENGDGGEDGEDGEADKAAEGGWCLKGGSKSKVDVDAAVRDTAVSTSVLGTVLPYIRTAAGTAIGCALAKHKSKASAALGPLPSSPAS